MISVAGNKHTKTTGKKKMNELMSQCYVDMPMTTQVHRSAAKTSTVMTIQNYTVMKHHGHFITVCLQLLVRSTREAKKN